MDANTENFLIRWLKALGRATIRFLKGEKILAPEFLPSNAPSARPAPAELPKPTPTAHVLPIAPRQPTNPGLPVVLENVPPPSDQPPAGGGTRLQSVTPDGMPLKKP